MRDWRERVAALGLSDAATVRATETFAGLAQHLTARGISAAATGAWWVPGRIEVLGKHTDYAGGRSLLAACERGFHVLAAPRADATIRITDASSGAMLTIALDANAPPRPGHWSDYPIAVARRIARDFPATATGMDAVIQSSLPSAAGLSSSSALVITTFLPLAAFNHLDDRAEWRSALGSPHAVAGYLGAVENGRTFGPFAADRGVGTHGGSEDQTAILTCRPGTLSQYHFLPVTLEAEMALPTDWIFAVAVSGVHAAKGAGAQAHYNHLAAQTAALLARWNEIAADHQPSLFAALTSAPGAARTLSAALDDAANPALRPRLEQFAAECLTIIPAVAAQLGAGHISEIGPLVDRSQALAEAALHNQVPETIGLVRQARELGAAAASAFGAGFGGSVWALVPSDGATDFLARWREHYLATWPARTSRADFFLTRPGPAARPI
ncbi:MAG TPA: galactokinase family protein [Gemmatimonadales bacterium]|jgi:galactokinase|nr:galactokinase family protein [Gemmatimonadales bacterium]